MAGTTMMKVGVPAYGDDNDGSGGLVKVTMVVVVQW